VQFTSVAYSHTVTIELPSSAFNGTKYGASAMNDHMSTNKMGLSGAKQAIYELVNRWRSLVAHDRERAEAELGDILLYLIRRANRAGIDLVAAATEQLSRDADRLPSCVAELKALSPAVAPAAGEPPRILIVEDERIVAADLQEVLNGFGYDAYAIASSGAEALAIAREKRPDIALMDIRIDGDVDGIEAAVQLRQKFDTAVIFVSAYADDATVERAKQSDPSAYLIKPVSARALKTTIELTAYRQRQAL
jgi:CheY-like chemotaxis protein/NTP pyrophosphatase (non-canonical NTP hydrolase)